jgi:DNA-binding NarL/FixJ family response regulator
MRKMQRGRTQTASVAMGGEQESAMKLRVYLVEDSAIMSPVLRTLIEATGAKVVGNSGAAATAIEDVKALQPDVVIIDIGLREGTGFDVLKALLHAKESEGTARVVLTNHALEPLRIAATRLGAAYFFDKSRQIPEMLRVLREMRRPARVASST